MKTDQVPALTTTFAGHAQQIEDGVDHWLAPVFGLSNQALKVSPPQSATTPL